MSEPVYKIEIYNPTGPTLRYTIISDALNINVKEVVTENIGNFSFILPSRKGDTYYYDDVLLNDIVKIWLGWDSISGDPITIGRIYGISAPLSTEEGYIRVFAGMNQGEVLSRRQKSSKWVSATAHDIVAELANDLSLGTGEIEADSTSVDMQVLDTPYFSVLQKVSDYWYDGGTQVKKDFYVDVDNNLVWKSRPLRTAGVETLTVGDNILSYNVFRDLKSVKNLIKVIGGPGAMFPSNGDSLTEQDDSETVEDDGWSTTGDAIDWNTTNPKVGSECVSGGANNDTSTELQNSFSSKKCYGYVFNKLHAWLQPYSSVQITEVVIRLLAPNTSHYFVRRVPGFPKVAPWEWQEIDWPIGPGTESDYVSEGWLAYGNANWGDVQGFVVYVENNASGICGSWIDGFYLGRRCYNDASDATSQSNYGVREYTLIDENLVSDADCQKRAEALLYQLKNPPIRLDVVTVGNTNVKIGDRLSMSIPAENISSVNFDVLTVEHSFSMQGFQTRASMINSANRRATPAISANELLKEVSGMQKLAAAGIAIIK